MRLDRFIAECAVESFLQEGFDFAERWVELLKGNVISFYDGPSDVETF